MKILLTNDDGIDSAGLLLLAEVLGKKHEVYLCAPDGQRSGHSHYIRFHQPIFAELKDICGTKLAYAISGSPADSVMFAIRYLGIQPDIVISGPNNGANMAYDIIYSGTVGAAQQGAILGYKSVALSCAAHSNCIFESCATFIEKNLRALYNFDYNKGLLNINVPNLPYDEIKGVKVTVQGYRLFSDRYDIKETEGKQAYYLEGLPQDVDDNDLTTDVSALKHNYISITPLTLDRTHHTIMDRTKECFDK